MNPEKYPGDEHMADRALKCVNLGNSSIVKDGYNVLVIGTRKIVDVVHVRFNEVRYPFSERSTWHNLGIQDTVPKAIVLARDDSLFDDSTENDVEYATPDFKANPAVRGMNADSVEKDTVDPVSESNDPSEVVVFPSSDEGIPALENSTASVEDLNLSPVEFQVDESVPDGVPRSLDFKQDHPPSELAPSNSPLVSIEEEVSLEDLGIQPETKRPVRNAGVPTKFLDHAMTLSPSLSIILSSVADPRPVHSSVLWRLELKGPEGPAVRVAQIKERNSLFERGVYGPIIELPDGQRALGMSWVHKKKLKGWKARSVVQGFGQRPGIEFFDTYAPTMKEETLPIFCLKHLQYPDSVMGNVDTVTAYLWASMDCVCHVRWPMPGFENEPDERAILSKLRKPCRRLLRSQYGVRQGMACFRTFQFDVHGKMGFSCLSADKCVFTLYRSPTFWIDVSYHVDDGLYVASNQKAADWYLEAARQFFDCTDETPPVDNSGVLTLKFIGHRIRILKRVRAIAIDQIEAIQAFIESMRMENCTPADTPYLSDFSYGGPDLLSSTTVEKDQVYTWYCSVMGSCRWFSRTRHDLKTALLLNSLVMHNPSLKTVPALKKMIRYLSGTRMLPWMLSLPHPPKPLAKWTLRYAVDSSHANLPGSASAAGFVAFLEGNTIFLVAHKQKNKSNSSTAAEKMELNMAGVHSTCMTSLCAGMRMPLEMPVSFLEDNQQAITLTSVGHQQKSTRWVRIAIDVFEQLVEEKLAVCVGVDTLENPADICTKDLARAPFLKHRDPVMGTAVARKLKLYTDPPSKKWSKTKPLPTSSLFMLKSEKIDSVTPVLDARAERRLRIIQEHEERLRQYDQDTVSLVDSLAIMSLSTKGSSSSSSSSSAPKRLSISARVVTPETSKFQRVKLENQPVYESKLVVVGPTEDEPKPSSFRHSNHYDAFKAKVTEEHWAQYGRAVWSFQGSKVFHHDQCPRVLRATADHAAFAKNCRKHREYPALDRGLKSCQADCCKQRW
jgi:hypothetical protein